MCSAAVTTLDCGALATTMPRFVAAGTSTLSTPTPARPIAFRRVARSMTSAVSFVAERMRIPSYSLDAVEVIALVDVEVLAQQRHAGGADLLGDEDAHQSPSRSTTQSMQAVSACTSARSIAGKSPMRSWLRPSLR